MHRLGFGAMRVTGPGIWGEPIDRAEALCTLRRVPDLGVNFIDTADAYGPEVSERLIRKALHPDRGLIIATKGGLTRPGPDRWTPNGRPGYLIAQAEKSCANLGVERIDLWQLHSIDHKVPRDEQFGAIRQLLDRKIIRFVGLSNVSVDDIKTAARCSPLQPYRTATILFDRSSEDVLEHCERHGIGFIPWCPLGASGLAKSQAVLDRIAQRYSATPGQIALGWLLKRSPVMLPIPGTSKVKHLEENVAAAEITLSDEDFGELDSAGRKP